MESIVERPSMFEFFRRWEECDSRAAALLATLNGMSVSGFISAVQDFTQGEIGHGIVKMATIAIPVGTSVLTEGLMLECDQVANSSNSSDKQNS